MEIKEVLALVQAGFTKAEIEAMLKPADPVPAEVVPEPEQEKPEVVTGEKLETAPAENTVNNELLNEVKELKTMLQRQALINDGFKQSNKDDAVSILASIINPPKD